VPARLMALWWNGAVDVTGVQAVVAGGGPLKFTAYTH
jgi:hypothetical protein